MKNLKQYKLINNRTFDLGNIPISSGRLTTVGVDTGQFGATQGYTGLNSDADSKSQLVASQITSSITSTASNIASPIMANALAAEAGSKLGTTWASGAALAAGYVAGGVNAVMGGVGLVNAFGSYKDRLSSELIASTSSKGTQTKFGVSYDQYGGVDKLGVLNYTDAQNRASNASAITSGVLTGAGVGGVAGTAIAGPVGSLVGSGIGALLGGVFGGIFGSSAADKRRKAIEMATLATAGQQTAYNRQAESEAGSKGLRLMYAAAHLNSVTGADKGKRPGQSLSYGDVAQIQTPQGFSMGKVEGLASHDEGMIDLATGETSYMGSADPSVIEQRKDNVPVGGGSNFNENVAIPGHMKDTDGIMFADKARPYFKANELIKMADSEIDRKIRENESNKKRDKNTMRFINKKLNKYKDEAALQYAANTLAISNIVDRLSAIQLAGAYDKGKTPRFKNGTHDIFGTRHGLANPLLGFTNGALYSALAQSAADSQQPYAYNSYVPNAQARSALQILGGLGYDASSDLAQLNTVAGQNRYAINSAGNLSAGQKMMLSTAANNDLFSKRRSIISDAYNKNAAYKQAYANALMSSGESAATRQQQALATQQDNYAKAVAAKQKPQEQARKNWYTTMQQSLKDWNSASMFNKTADMWDLKYGNKTKSTTDDGISDKDAQKLDSFIDNYNDDDLYEFMTGYWDLLPTLKAPELDKGKSPRRRFNKGKSAKSILPF